MRLILLSVLLFGSLLGLGLGLGRGVGLGVRCGLLGLVGVRSDGLGHGGAI